MSEQSPTLLAFLIAKDERTHDEIVAKFERCARDNGEVTTLSVRTLRRWIAGDVRTAPRPSQRRVARLFWGHPMTELLAPVRSVQRPPAGEAVNDMSIGEPSSPSDVAARTAGDAADVDLVELASVLDQRGISGGALVAVELTCARIDQQFARLGPDEVLARVRVLMGAVVHQLHGPQSLGHQRRLVALAGRLAGLRAWGCFDVDEHGEAERWYDVAVTAAQEAEAWSLGAWLLGAQSLIPWHRRDHRQTVATIERGIYFAGRGTDSTTLAWLRALEARGRASLGDRHGFETAYARAEEAAEYSSERDRRHGMDFAQGLLDLRYYAGTSRLLLRQPDRAVGELHGSLAALPGSHTKAQAVLRLALADAAVQSDDVGQAIDLARRALTATRHQPIMPILQQARRIRRLVQQHSPREARTLDDELSGFARALTAVATRTEL
jgi:hypothetical protein